MALKGTYETIKQAFQDIIAPQLERINGEIAGLKTQIHSLERRTDEGFASIRNEMGSLRNEMGSLEKRMEEGFVSIRNEMGSLEKRMDDGFVSVRNEMDSLRGEMRQGLAYSNKRVDEVLEIRERLATLEAKLATRN
jgi:predicted  nucleic acid-binding Zn-ribbon protein